MSTREQQYYTEEYNEAKFAKLVGGKSLPDSEPIDILIKRDNKPDHGIELKTMVTNKADKITMRGPARQKKKAWEQGSGGVFHTIVFDDRNVFQANGDIGSLNPGDPGYADLHDESQRIIYYRRGAGSFRIGNMHKVSDIEELKRLMDAPEADLPKNAQPPKTWLKLIGVASKRPVK